MINALDVLQQLDITKVGLATETTPWPFPSNNLCFPG